MKDLIEWLERLHALAPGDGFADRLFRVASPTPVGFEAGPIRLVDINKPVQQSVGSLPLRLLL